MRARISLSGRVIMLLVVLVVEVSPLGAPNSGFGPPRQGLDLYERMANTILELRTKISRMERSCCSCTGNVTLGGVSREGDRVWDGSISSQSETHHNSNSSSLNFLQLDEETKDQDFPDYEVMMAIRQHFIKYAERKAERTGSKGALRRILRYMSEGKMYCKWRRVVRCNSLFEVVAFRTAGARSQLEMPMPDLFSKLPKLKNLNFDPRISIYGTLPDVSNLQNLKSWRVQNYNGTHMPDILPSSVRDFMLKGHNVKTAAPGVLPKTLDKLCISSRRLEASFFQNAFRDLRSVKTIKVLFQAPTLNNTYGFSSELPKELTNVSVLRSLAIKSGLGDGDWRQTTFNVTKIMELKDDMRVVRLVGLGMSTIPSVIRNMKGRIVMLDLSKNKFTGFPEIFSSSSFGLTIEKLDMSMNLLTRKPPMRDLASLQGKAETFQFWMKDNPVISTEKEETAISNDIVAAVGKFMEDLQNFTTVMIPPHPGSMEGICKLDMFMCHEGLLNGVSLQGLALDALPASIAYLSTARTLILKENFFSHIPTILKNMTGLKMLDLSNNQVKDVGVWLFDMPLRHIILNHNIIQDLPPAEELQNNALSVYTLQNLEITNNKLETIPDIVLRMRQMADLSLDHNRIKTLLKGLRKMTRLRALSLSNNLLTDEGMRIPRWPSLHKLHLNYNRLSEMPTFGDVPTSMNSVSVSMAFNKISTFSKEAARSMEKMHFDLLVLHGNNFTELPHTFAEISVDKLNLRYCNIETIRAETLIMMDVTHLWMDFNNLRELPDLEDIEGKPYAQAKKVKTKTTIEYDFSSNGIERIGRGFPYVLEEQRASIDLMLHFNHITRIERGFGVKKPGSTVHIDYHSLMLVPSPITGHAIGEEEKHMLENEFRKGSFEREVVGPDLNNLLNYIVRPLHTGHGKVLNAGIWGITKEAPEFHECISFTYRLMGVNVGIVRCLCMDKFYRSLASKYECRQCPELAVCTQDEIQCPANTHIHYLNEESMMGELASEMKCEACPVGGKCDGVMVTAMEGFFKLEPASSLVLSCPNPEACQGGEESNCARGYTGVLCGKCDHGYFQSGAHTCVQCPEPSVSIAVFSLSVLGLVATALIVFALAASIIADQRSKEAKREARISKVMTSLRSTEFFKMIVNFLQLITSFRLTFDVSWPISLDYLDQVFGWVSLDFIKATSLECIWELSSNSEDPAETVENTGFGYRERLVFTVSIPIALSMTLVVMYVATSCYLRVECLRKRSPISREVLKRIVMSNNLLLWQLCYLPISYLCIEYFNCLSFDDGATFYIKNDLSTKCYDAKYWTIAPVAVAAIIVYTVGMPVAIIAITVLKRKELSSPEMLQSIGAIYKPYKREYAYWEAIEMVRKVVVGGAVILLGGSATFQITVALAILFIFMIVHCRFWPSASNTSNIIQGALLALTYFTMCLGLLKTLEVPKTQRSVFSNVVVALDFLAVSVIFALIAYDLCCLLMEKFAKLQKVIEKRAALSRKLEKIRHARK